MEKKHLLIGLGAGALVVGLALAARSQPAGPTGTTVDWKNARVLVLGDSLAVGLSTPLKAAFKQMGVPFKSEAVSGSSIKQWAVGKHAGALDKAIAEFKPTVVLVSLGTNDEVVRKSKPTTDVSKATEADVDTLLRKLAGAQVIWIGLPSFAGWPADPGFRTMLASKVSGRYFNTAANDSAFARAKDRVHFTGAGYKQWAGDLMGWILEKNPR